ncbi:MAG: DsbA family protein [Betaproteobacteria bacterium]|nr:MAG: DsbA family protein [Betaproteobacteria bacterium]
MTTLAIDFYISMRSPYSYLVTPRLAKLTETYDVEITARPVYALAARDPNFFKKINPLWLSYFKKDTLRTAEFLGVPFGRPRPDPIVQDLDTGTIAADQPYIRGLTRLAAAGSERGRGFALVREVSALIFDGTIDGWNEGDHLKNAVARAGLDFDELNTAIKVDPDHYDAIIAANQDAQKAVGHWGTPLMVFNGEPFFGQDRFEMLKWRLEQNGLTRRS